MGKERDVPLPERTGRTLRYDSQDVCKYELCGLCPYTLFKNTRSDWLGKFRVSQGALTARLAAFCIQHPGFKFTNCAGPCQFDVHEEHIEWEAIVKDLHALDDAERKRCFSEPGLADQPLRTTISPLFSLTGIAQYHNRLFLGTSKTPYRLYSLRR
jgi:ribosome modulation factor